MRHGLLVVRRLRQEFAVGSAHSIGNHARIEPVAGVSFDVGRGEILGLVGESGSGKTTLARTLLQSPPPRDGSVQLRGLELTRMQGRALVELRRDMQMVFQDPFGSLNPKWTVASIVEEPLIGFRIGTRRERRRRVDALLERVGLVGFGTRRPRELSGGQCQRVAIARALAPEPRLIICDEAVASLDTLAQAQVLDLFEQLRRDLGVAFLFISHNLLLVRAISRRIAVMHAGQLCEIGPAERVYRYPKHPYTAGLIACAEAPANIEQREVATMLNCEPPSPINPPSGCRFRTRCTHVGPQCAAETPPLTSSNDGRAIACHFPLT